jgi:hypothetical protein
MFKIIKCLTHFQHDQLIRKSLIDIWHVPIEYFAIFFHQLFHVGDYLISVSVQFLLLDLCHFIFPMFWF